MHGAEIDLHKITTNENYFICMAALEIVEMGNMKASESFLFCIISIQKTKTITVLIKKMVEMKKGNFPQSETQGEICPSSITEKHNCFENIYPKLTAEGWEHV